MAILKPEFRELTEQDISELVAIGRKQAALVDQLAEALAVADTPRALDLARQICSMEQQVKQ